jgi:hypothetical protein
MCETAGMRKGIENRLGPGGRVLSRAVTGPGTSAQKLLERWLGFVLKQRLASGREV